VVHKRKHTLAFDGLLKYLDEKAMKQWLKNYTFDEKKSLNRCGHGWKYSNGGDPRYDLCLAQRPSIICQIIQSG
jgi:hypothetical protein